ncbi:MAG TPA: hypothetical protein VIK14_11305 [Ignavibacteria bacterium]|jgi:hypothetical protein
MINEERKYKSRLDFYYNSLIIYLLFFVLYVLIRGEFSNEKFSILFKDPIIYIIMMFIFFFLIILISNAVKARTLIFKEDKIILKNRFGQRELNKSEILFVRFSGERKRRSEEKSQIRIVKLKLLNRKRLLRIRLSEYNNERELINEFRSIAKEIPGKNAKK